MNRLHHFIYIIFKKKLQYIVHLSLKTRISVSCCPVQLHPSNLWKQRLIHYSDNMGLN